ncbi:MAG: hypothetical protein ACTHOD_17965 [Motilibacteraceae bacterium]
MTSAVTPTPAPSSSADVADVLAHVDWARIVPMRCAPIPVVVDQVLVADVTGDGVPDALVKARCDAAAGSPPSSLFAYAGGEQGPTPLGPLVTERDDVLLGPVTTAGGVVSVKATSWSGPDVPRCCPDVERVLRWRWDGHALAPVP